MIVIFVQKTRVRRFQIFHSTNFLGTARMPCDFPLAVVFATSTSSRSVKIKMYRIGYEIGYSQLGPVGHVGYLPFHVQRTLTE